MYDSDLFEETEFLPIEIQKLLNDFSMSDNSYQDCENLLTECLKLGYTFEYGLDAVPFNLKAIQP